jgi:uncharacterized protein (UPF0335 family)
MAEATTKAGGGIAAEQLRRLVQRIERLEEEKADVGAQIKDVYAEAKAHGFDVKTLRHVIRLRRMDSAQRAEQDALLALYRAAVGLD